MFSSDPAKDAFRREKFHKWRFLDHVKLILLHNIHIRDRTTIYRVAPAYVQAGLIQ